MLLIPALKYDSFIPCAPAESPGAPLPLPFRAPLMAPLTVSEPLPPELPEDGEHIDGIPGLTEELLDALLDAGIITEDEYEALLELVPAVDVSEA